MAIKKLPLLLAVFACFAVVALVAALSAIMSWDPLAPSTNPALAPIVPDHAATEAEAARKAATRDRVLAVMGTLRSQMRDPESLKYESIRANDDGSVICIAYRARNGFGGMNRELVTVVNNTRYQDVADWNRHCTQPLTAF